ncbi:MAG: pyroglutamyl-peptidase I [Clostridia bacterium]|nr:pyroglutamyl-peptidase I [Clostridia bacterium]
MEPKTLLITGFAPFGAEAVNPSWEAVKALPEHIGAWTLHKLLLPVEYGRAAKLALKAAEDCGADAILCAGLAAGRTAVTPEAVGVNARDAAIPDNAGRKCEGEPVEPDGPAAFFSTLPVRRMTEAIHAAGIPAKLSYTAGTYVCNDLLYTLLCRFSGTQVRVAFVHIPLEKDLPLGESIRALIAAIEAI